MVSCRKVTRLVEAAGFGGCVICMLTELNGEVKHLQHSQEGSHGQFWKAVFGVRRRPAQCSYLAAIQVSFFFFFLAEVCFSSAVLYGAEEGISFVFKSCSLSLHRTEIGTKLGRNVLSHRHEQFSSAQWAQPGGT